jgi:NAD(P) transhydrogenase subunit beta
LALVIGTITFTGSLVAAAKLNGQLKPRPIIWKGHGWLSILSLSVAVLMIAVFRIYLPVKAAVVMALLSGGIFGILFSVRVGGADMPITISLLNSLSGVAAGITGMAIRDPLLVVIGGVVGASGLLLTQIMCRAMNRGLWDILLGIKAAHFETAVNTAGGDYTADAAPQAGSSPEEASAADNPVDWLRQARDVIIVPGYGMALSQAQVCVKELQSALEGNGAAVRYAIHPVAGRMPGHMNVLLAEVDVPYDQLYEIDMINDAFCTCDLCIVIGANDVVNPAANTAVGTPIYGMPILNADGAPRILLLNFDAKPGYAGVDNPLYTRQHGVIPLLGDAKETLERLLAQFRI